MSISLFRENQGLRAILAKAPSGPACVVEEAHESVAL